MGKYEVRIIPLEGNIAKHKNKALSDMLASDADYFFLIEENCQVVNDKVFEIFMETSEKTGIQALMYPREEINKKLPFEDDPYIDYYADFVSSFSMYTREAVKAAKYFDEKMPENTWQDIEYAKRVGDLGLSTPFGMFAAPKNVDEYFTITRYDKEYKNLKEMDKALTYWQAKSIEDFPINIAKTKRADTIEML